MTMNSEKNFFYEQTPFNWGTSLAVQIKEKIAEYRSAFQKIEVYDTETVGRMLVLDGVIQLTEFDEFAYHEMFVHVPMAVHPNPSSVLVIGGGDGGILRELVRYPQLQRIDICEIDGEVIQVSKAHLPFTACGYDDPRVKVYVEDGAEFLTRHHSTYDLILVDSSDPVGPAEVLFRRPFFTSLKAALKPNGAALTQCETVFLYLSVIEQLLGDIKGLFPRLQYMNTLVPTYPSGMIGQLVCSMGPDFSAPLKPPSSEIQDQLRYYTPEVHRAAFTLPRFASERLKPYLIGG